MRNHHFLLVCFPAFGHINPSLQLAQRLISLGAHVTFATTVAAVHRLDKAHNTLAAPGFSLTTFSDAFDGEAPKPDFDFAQYFDQLRRRGSESLTNLITSSASHGRPITFVIYSLLLNWAAEVASTFDIPSAILFVQPATILALYYYAFVDGYEGVISTKLLQEGSEFSIKLTGLPLLAGLDIPSFLSPSDRHAFLLPPMRQQFEFLGRQARPTVLVNTFHALEVEALGAIEKLKMVPIGPLVPSDLCSPISSEDYIQWLDSKTDSSVIYISFGSICELSYQQEEEIIIALLESGHTFLWVIRSKENGDVEEEERMRRFGGKGKIVRWCNQLHVLSHPSLSCFMTHCGWNSTLESLVNGVPMVGFPQQVDQGTNAKLVEDVWRTGVRVQANGEGIVEREEIRRCLSIVMGDMDVERREEIVKNAKKWKELGREAIGEGGSSCLNLQTFVREIDEGC